MCLRIDILTLPFPLRPRELSPLMPRASSAVLIINPRFIHDATPDVSGDVSDDAAVSLSSSPRLSPCRARFAPLTQETRRANGKKISALEEERQFPPYLRILFLPALEVPGCTL